MGRLRQRSWSNLNAHCFAIEVECFISQLHQELKGGFGFFCCDHDIMQINSFALDETFADSAAFELLIVDAFEKLLQRFIKTWTGRLWGCLPDTTR